MSFTSRIKEKAIELGFDLVGVAPAQPTVHAGAFRSWLANGYQGEMTWLARDPEWRMDPARVLKGARSVIAVGISYAVEEPPAAIWNDPSRGRIARYAWLPDYHETMTPRLQALAAFVQRESASAANVRVYVDTGPVLERAMAAQAGLGFIGKNSLLNHPDYGSYL